MAVLRIARHINAPRAVVFAAATDIGRRAEYEYTDDIERARTVMGGSIGLGTRFYQPPGSRGHKTRQSSEVTEFDAPKRLAIQTECGGMHVATEYDFLPDISGTLVEVVVRRRPVTFAAWVRAPLSRIAFGPFKKHVAAGLDDLKRIAEARAATEWHTDPDAAIHGYETSGA